MRLDTQPLLLVAERLAQSGHLEQSAYENRRHTLTTLEGRLVVKQSHLEAYEVSRAAVVLDGSALAWARWRAEHQFLTLARAEASRLEGLIRFEMELLEREVALAQQQRARAVATGGAGVRIYVASSWRNEGRQQAVVQALREAGHEVYDFRNPPNGSGFGWKQVGSGDPSTLTPADFRQVLTHPRAQEGFRSDMGALENCDACVLVLPCGRSAHLELGWAAGARKRTFVLLAEEMGEPELMLKVADEMCLSIPELVNRLEEAQPPVTSRAGPPDNETDRVLHAGLGLHAPLPHAEASARIGQLEQEAGRLSANLTEAYRKADEARERGEEAMRSAAIVAIHEVCSREAALELYQELKAAIEGAAP